VLLGDIIARLTDETTATETILGLGDISLLTEMRLHAEDNRLALGDYASWAVRTYADNAPPDEWTTLIGALGRSDDPGGVCLRRALSYVLDRASPAVVDGSLDKHRADVGGPPFG
jgi:hypothetical protein